MAGGISKLTYAEINSIADQLKNKADSMNELLTGPITTEINRVGTEGVWSGDAAEDVKAEFNKIASHFKEFYDAAVSCSTYLKQMVENYQSVDRAITGQK